MKHQILVQPAVTIAPEGKLIVHPVSSDATSLSVVVPTLNEAENIGSFLSELSNLLDAVLPDSYEIIVVDDNSSDGTLEIAKAVAETHPEIRLVRREGKRELATAVIRGWQMSRGRVLATINADFQHPPSLITDMWELIGLNVDLVAASRYGEMGSTGEWTISRRILSRGAMQLGKILLPEVYRRVSDPLSGCFMLRRETVAGVELKPLGFKSLIEVLVRGQVVSIAECPYTMNPRQRGSSKARPLRSLDYVRQLIRLRAARRKSRR